MNPGPRNLFTRWRPAGIAVVLSLAFLAAHAWPAQGAAGNILLVIADDFGIDSQSLYNTNPAASLPPTPNINALAARGVRFANSYAYPTCSPTRSAILTGRYGFRTGVTQVLDTAAAQGIHTNEFTLPEALSPGYRCGSFGKWHLGGVASSPNAVGGWPQFSGSLPGALGQNAANFYNWTKVSNGVTRANFTGYATTDNVNDALTWVAAQGTNRWFLWLAFNAPHTPYHLPPTNLCPHYSGLSGTSTDIQQNPRAYFEASVEAMDTELGRLLAGVDVAQTTVLFLGDNGTAPRVIQPPYTMSGRAKDSLYEGGVRVPFIVAGPDLVRPGRVSEDVVHAVDLHATIIELAGLDLPAILPQGLPSDSRSLLPILRDAPFSPAEPAVLMEDPDALPAGTLTGRAVRLGQLKLIDRESGVDELYDLRSDPLESTNLLAGVLTDSQQAGLEELRAKLARWSNVPRIHRQAFQDGAFSVEVGWFVNPAFSLWRKTDLADSEWSLLSNLTWLDLGATVRVSDPSPPGGGAFYRVSTP